MTYPWLESIILASIGTIVFYICIRFLNTHPLKGFYFKNAWLSNKKYYEWMMGHPWFFVVFFCFLMLVIYLRITFF